MQRSRSWQPYVEGKNGNKNFRQARIYFFRDKRAVFACNCKFANLTQYNMQYIPCNSAFLAQETMFLTKKKLSFYHFSFSTKFLLFSIILYYSPLIFFSISTMFLIIVHHFFSPSPPNFCLLKISDQYEISQTFLGKFVLASSLVISHYLLQTGPSRFTRQAKSVYNNTNSFA